MPKHQPAHADTYFALARHLHNPNESILRRKTELLFKGVDLRGKRVLDVGGGTGMMSFYAASRGAHRVVCLEPSEAGSNPAMDEQFLKWQAGLGPGVKVDLVRETFQNLDPADQKYDVVLIHNAINHLDEEACARLQYDANARAAYVSMFQKLADLTSDGGDLIITDAGRKNAWNALGLRSPFAPTIEWDIHQQPKIWAGLAAAGGFSETQITWRSHDKLGTAGQALLGNRVGGWLTNSMFILRMRRS